MRTSIYITILFHAIFFANHSAVAQFRDNYQPFERNNYYTNYDYSKDSEMITVPPDMSDIEMNYKIPDLIEDPFYTTTPRFDYNWDPGIPDFEPLNNSRSFETFNTYDNFHNFNNHTFGSSSSPTYIPPSPDINNFGNRW